MNSFLLPIFLFDISQQSVPRELSGKSINCEGELKFINKHLNSTAKTILNRPEYVLMEQHVIFVFLSN